MPAAVNTTQPPLLSPRFDRALAYASALHREQRRKGSNVPYVAHLLGVAAIALEAGADEDQAIAALLHDAVEDQGGPPRLAEIGDLFGADVATIVDHCTDSDTEPKPPWRARKEAYIAGLAAKPARSLLVSLSDKTYNAEAILLDYIAIGDALWSRFTGGRDGTIWYYRSLADTFARLLPGPLAERFGRVVADIERHAAA